MTPDERGEYPYNPTEHFSHDEIARAIRLRRDVGAVKMGDRNDSCPHTPPCPNARICVEEIAWYLRHRTELDV